MVVGNKDKTRGNNGHWCGAMETLVMVMVQCSNIVHQNYSHDQKGSTVGWALALHAVKPGLIAGILIVTQLEPSRNDHCVQSQ